MTFLFLWNWRLLAIPVDGQSHRLVEDGVLLDIRNAGKLSYTQPDGS